ncbi:MAG TPA: CHAT domain-containing protein [Acidobacteriota bacterium]|nr:CHAT domain-containing protein [Acidobacteriota bacterium]
MRDCFLLFALATWFGLTPVSGVAASKRQAPLLDLNHPLEKGLKSGEKHEFRLTVEANTLVKVLVEQISLDVVVTLQTADGQLVAETNSTPANFEAEQLFLVLERAGTYLVQVTPVAKEPSEGKFTITLAEVHPATAQDLQRVALEKQYQRGLELAADPTREKQAQAIETFQAVAMQAEISGDTALQIEAFNQVGTRLFGQGKPKLALPAFEKVLELVRTLKDAKKEASTLNNLGVVHNLLGNSDKAIEYLEQTLPLQKATGNLKGYGMTLNNLGAIYTKLGQKQKTLDYLEQALVVHRQVNNQAGAAQTLANLGKLYVEVGNRSKALEVTQEALSIAQAIGNPAQEISALGVLGDSYNQWGETKKALPYFEQALAICQRIGDQARETAMLSNLAAIYKSLGDFQKALNTYDRVLALTRAVGNRSWEASTLANQGSVYQKLGQNSKAIQLTEEAYGLAQKVDPTMVPVYLLTLGVLYGNDQNWAKSHELFEQVLGQFQQQKNARWEAVTLSNLGWVESQTGNYPKAIEYLNQANAVRQTIGNRYESAGTFHNLGWAYSQMKDYPQAEANYKKALDLDQELGHKSGIARTLGHLALVEASQKKLIQARKSIEQAIEILESIRSDVTNQELRATYFSSNSRYYKTYIDILMALHQQSPEAGYAAHALTVSERARARSLLELLTEANLDLKEGIAPELLDREQELRHKIKFKLGKLSQLLAQKHTVEQETTAKAEIEQLTDEFRQVQAEIREKSPRYGALTQPQPMTASEIQRRVLDSDTVLLEYFLGSETSFLWALSHQTLNVYALPGQAVIDELVQKSHAGWKTRRQRAIARKTGDINSPAGISQDPARQLSQMILGPAAKELAGKRLVVVPDGSLHYVSFAALPDPTSSVGEPLVVHHELVVLPSASTLGVLREEAERRKPAEKTLAVLADPVFSLEDTRLLNHKSASAPDLHSEPTALSETSRAIEARLIKGGDTSPLQGEGTRAQRSLVLARLPFTRSEAEHLATLTAATVTLKAVGFAANRELVLSEKLDRYRYVHFATHGLLDAEQPELTSLVLSLVNEQGNPQDGFLRALDIYNLKLNAEVVTLSACESGLGKTLKGEGVIGLTRGFMYAGAKRVVVSLWSVNDQATSELMTRFYRGILKEKLTPAAALRRAQVELRQHKQWQSPYFWAAFQLQGDWR